MPQTARKSRKSRKSNKPRTLNKAKAARQRTPRQPKAKESTFTVQWKSETQKPKSKHSLDSMSMTDLQNMAMSMGVAFGGLSRSQLREKLIKLR